MSDRSDETGPAPETPGGESDAAHGETAPESARHETPPPAPADDTADPHPDDTITLPADALTARPTEETPSPPSDDSAGPPTGDRDTPAIREPETTALPTGDTPDHETRVQPAPAATQPAFQRAAIAADRAEPPAGPLQHTAVFDRPGGKPFLAASGLTAHGRQGPIFTDITVTAGLGQLVAICGDGGDGRSSLLLALTGRFPHRSGELEVDGQTTPGQIRRRFTIAQAGPPIRFEPYATVGACIKETTTVSKGTATRANINAWLDRLAVGVDTGDTFGFLPRIDQIRFAIACAAASRTPAIAVDDADTGLDRCGSERVFEALRTVADAGQLVLAACTRSDPPADTVVDLRAQPAPDASALHASDRNGGHR
ncbi:ATP-binding cassette domain-containing protein [Glycomyces sp. NPDC021274]|uniref:ATP-binding cassette domain-containing protein n=1 Tax=Glycomyces sp. NPDC021274 TaxID=3155120 RepID=UPI0033D98A83